MNKLFDKIGKEAIEEFNTLSDTRIIYRDHVLFNTQKRRVNLYVVLLQYMDSAEFEARVAQKLLTLDREDVPCGHGMTIFCPNPPFKNKDCGAWCLLREARLQVEKEMEENQ